jgi:circadian clock protein KaiC
MRQIDLLKARGVTGIFTTLVHSVSDDESVVGNLSSLVDTWILLRNQESYGERNRLLFVVKSRGSAHSNQVREFVLTDRGAELVDVYVGPEAVLTGSARLSQLDEERAAAQAHRVELERRRRARTRHAAVVEQQIAALREELAAEQEELETLEAADRAVASAESADRVGMAVHRQADRPPGSTTSSAAPSEAPTEAPLPDGSVR